jgi:hypothetical protein
MAGPRGCAGGHAHPRSGFASFVGEGRLVSSGCQANQVRTAGISRAEAVALGAGGKADHHGSDGEDPGRPNGQDRSGKASRAPTTGITGPIESNTLVDSSITTTSFIQAGPGCCPEARRATSALAVGWSRSRMSPSEASGRHLPLTS